MVRREQFTNLAADDLNEPTDIDASQTTITLTDASEFPTEGDFRILIDSEIMLVTGVSGNDFTVVRGAEGTTGILHLDAAVVTAVLTGAALEQVLDDATGGFTVRKAAMRFEDDAGAIMTASSFTWSNQGTATAADDGKGGIVMTMPSEAAHQLRGKYITAPSTPYRVDCLCQFGPGTVTNSHMGLFLEESGTGKQVIQRLRLNDTVAMWNMNSVSSFNSNVDSAHEFNSDRLWLTIEDNGTNILGRASVDGVNFINLWSDPRLTFLTGGANRVGFYANSTSSVAGALFHFHAFRVS